MKYSHIIIIILISIVLLLLLFNVINYTNNKGEVASSTDGVFILKKEFRKDNDNCLSSIIPSFHKIIIS